MDLPSIEIAVALAEQRWPGFEFQITSNDEAHGPCPFEGVGDDRFFFNCNGHYFCRQCRKSGFIDEHEHLTPDELRLRRIEAEQARQARKQRELERRLSALERMAQCLPLVDEYHRMLDDNDRAWWYSQGINDDSIERYQLGVCYACPTADGPSYTIPVFDSTEKILLNIRHRLIEPNGHGKYRPHIAGLPVSLYRSQNVLTHDDLVLCEGEKKVIVLEQHGFPSVGIFGKNGFNFSWLKHFDGVQRLTVALDPDANGAAIRLGEEIKRRAGHIDVRVAEFPLKPDDLFIGGGTEADFRLFIEYARRV